MQSLIDQDINSEQKIIRFQKWYKYKLEELIINFLKCIK